MSEPKEILSVDEVADLLGVHKQTVYDYAGMGELPHRRLGRRLIFSRKAILAWAARETAA